jgi:hypothetical protein
MPSSVAIQLLAWFIREPDGRLRLATEEEAVAIRLGRSVDTDAPKSGQPCG